MDDNRVIVKLKSSSILTLIPYGIKEENNGVVFHFLISDYSKIKVIILEEEIDYIISLTNEIAKNKDEYINLIKKMGCNNEKKNLYI